MHDNYKKLDEGYLLTLNNKYYWLNRKVIAHIKENHFEEGQTFDSVFNKELTIEDILDIFIYGEKKIFSEGIVVNNTTPVGFNCFCSEMTNIEGVIVKKGRHNTTIIPCQINDNIGNADKPNNGKTKSITLILQEGATVSFAKGFDFRSDPNYAVELDKLYKLKKLGLVVTAFPGSVLNELGHKQPRAYAFEKEGFYIKKDHPNFIPFDHDNGVTRKIIHIINNYCINDKLIVSNDVISSLLQSLYEKYSIENDIPKLNNYIKTVVAKM